MSCFSGILNQSDAFASLNRAWTTGSRPVGAVGLSETGKALVLHALYEQQKKPLLLKNAQGEPLPYKLEFSN